MLAAADHLWVRRVGFAPLAPTGVALGASIREVSHVGPGLSTSDLPIRTFDTYVSCSFLLALISLSKGELICSNHQLVVSLLIRRRLNEL